MLFMVSHGLIVLEINLKHCLAWEFLGLTQYNNIKKRRDTGLVNINN